MARLTLEEYEAGIEARRKRLRAEKAAESIKPETKEPEPKQPKRSNIPDLEALGAIDSSEAAKMTTEDMIVDSNINQQYLNDKPIRVDPAKAEAKERTSKLFSDIPTADYQDSLDPITKIPRIPGLNYSASPVLVDEEKPMTKVSPFPITTAILPKVTTPSNQGTVYDQPAEIDLSSIADEADRSWAAKADRAVGDAISYAKETKKRTDVGYNAKSPLEQALSIENEINGLSDIFQGKGPKVDTGFYNMEEDKRLSPEQRGFFRAVLSTPNQSNVIPKMSDVQLDYLWAYRNSLVAQVRDERIKAGSSMQEADRYANDFVARKIGNDPWWADKGSRQRGLAKQPEFKGMIPGLGVTEYSTGATVETSPAYIARMASAPSNIAVGLAATATGKIFPAIGEQRKKSEMGAVSSDSFILSALDSVYQNRGMGEEFYDVADAYTDKAWVKNTAYGAGLLLDIVALDFIPFSGLATGGMKGANTVADTNKILKTLPGIAKLSPAETAKIVGAAALNEWSPLLARGVGVEANDVRLLSAPRISDYIQAKEIIRSSEGMDPKDIVAALETSLGKDNTFVEASRKALKEGTFDSLKKDILRPTKEGKRLSGAYRGSIEDLVGFGVEGRLSTLNAKDISRIVRTASIHPEVSSVLKNLGARATAKEAINALLDNTATNRVLERIVAQEIGIKEAISLGKKAGIPDNILMITPNTAVKGRNTRERIFEDVSKREIATTLKTAGKRKEGIRYLINPLTQTKESYILLTNTEADNLMDALSIATRGDPALEARASAILNDLRSEDISLGYRKISTSNARDLLNLEIDSVARYGVDGKAVSFSSEEIRKLTPQNQELIRQAPELRPGFIQRKATEIYRDYTKADDGLKIVLSRDPEVANTVRNISSELSTASSNLTKEIKQLQSNQIVRDNYGIPKGVVLNEQEAFAYLLRGPTREIVLLPNGSRTIMPINPEIGYEDTLSKLDDLAIYERPIGYYETIKSYFFPESFNYSDFLKKNNVISGQAEAIRAKYIDAFKKMADPGKQYIPLLRGYITETRQLLTNSKLENVTVLSDKAINDILPSVWFNKNKDIVIKRNVNNLIFNFWGTSTGIWGGKGIPSYGPVMDSIIKNRDVMLNLIGARAYQIVSSNVEGKADILTTNGFIQLLRDGASRNTAVGPRGIGNELLRQQQAGITSLEDILGILKKTDNDEIMKDLGINYSQLAEISDIVDSFARISIERYGLSSKNYGDVVQLFDDVINGSTRSWEEAVGQPTIKFIEDTIGKGHDIETFRGFIRKLQLADNDKAVRRMKWIGSEFDKLTSLQYSLMLSFRPRFHVMNILTAPWLIASTLGGGTAASSLTRFFTAYKAMSHLNGDDALAMSKVAIRDNAGRIWTLGDIIKAVKDSGALKSQASFISGKGLSDRLSESLTIDGEGRTIATIEPKKIVALPPKEQFVYTALPDVNAAKAKPPVEATAPIKKLEPKEESVIEITEDLEFDISKIPSKEESVIELTEDEIRYPFGSIDSNPFIKEENVTKLPSVNERYASKLEEEKDHLFGLALDLDEDLDKLMKIEIEVRTEGAALEAELKDLQSLKDEGVDVSLRIKEMTAKAEADDAKAGELADMKELFKAKYGITGTGSSMGALFEAAQRAKNSLKVMSDNLAAVESLLKTTDYNYRPEHIKLLEDVEKILDPISATEDEFLAMLDTINISYKDYIDASARRTIYAMQNPNGKPPTTPSGGKVLGFDPRSRRGAININSFLPKFVQDFIERNTEAPKVVAPPVPKEVLNAAQLNAAGRLDLAPGSLDANAKQYALWLVTKIKDSKAVPQIDWMKIIEERNRLGLKPTSTQQEKLFALEDRLYRKYIGAGSSEKTTKATIGSSTTNTMSPAQSRRALKELGVDLGPSPTVRPKTPEQIKRETLAALPPDADIQSQLKKLGVDFNVKNDPFKGRRGAVIPKAIWDVVSIPAKGFNYLSDGLKAFAEGQDEFFRMTTIIDSLDKGEDISVAIEKGRNALYDYNKLSSFEKTYLNKAFLFWSFQALTVRTFFSNLLNNPTRLMNAMKLNKGYPFFTQPASEDVGFDPTKDSIYFPSWQFGRGTMGKINEQGQREIGPSIPMNDQFIIFANALAPFSTKSYPERIADYSKTIFRGQSPGLTMLLGMIGDEKVDKDFSIKRAEQGWIAPEDQALIMAMAGGEKAFRSLIGPIEWVEGSEGYASFRTKANQKFIWKIPDTNKAGIDRYVTLKKLASGMGASSIVRDYAPVITNIGNLSNRYPDLDKGKNLYFDPLDFIGLTTNVDVKEPSYYTEKSASFQERKAPKQ